MEVSQVEMGNAFGGSAPSTPHYETPAPVAQASHETSPSAERVRQMATEMQRQIDQMNVSLEFTSYAGGKKLAVVIADKVTGEVIREIPSRELQQLYSMMDELNGMLFNRQV
jgi:uncharacterized FlaG/YvyC family protein